MKIDQFLTKVKPGTLAIILGVIAVALYFLFKKKATPQASEEAVNNVVVNNKNLQNSTIDLDFMTSELLDAMNQFGTDTDSIFNVLISLKSKDDLLYVIKAFGVKPYYITGLADGLVTRFMGTDKNLIGWFQEELSDNDLAKVSAIFKKLGVDMLSYE